MDAKGSSSMMLRILPGRKGRGMIPPDMNSTRDRDMTLIPRGDRVKNVAMYIIMENATTTRNPSIMDKRNRTAVLASGGRTRPYGLGRSRAVKRMGMHLNTALEALLARLLTNHME